MDLVTVLSNAMILLLLVHGLLVLSLCVCVCLVLDCDIVLSVLYSFAIISLREKAGCFTLIVYVSLLSCGCLLLCLKVSRVRQRSVIGMFLDFSFTLFRYIH